VSSSITGSPASGVSPKAAIVHTVPGLNGGDGLGPPQPTIQRTTAIDKGAPCRPLCELK
jgi:hypothetical protein